MAIDREASDSKSGAAPKNRKDIAFSEPPMPQTITSTEPGVLVGGHDGE